MKTTLKSAISFFLILSLVFCMTGCGAKNAGNTENDLWAGALYTEDTEFGEGEKTVAVEVEAGDKSVTFTIHTDTETVGAALIEHELIAGEEGEYGLYVKEVNGITADYDVDQTYWAFNIDGEMAMTGVDGTEINESAAYQLVYTK